MGMAASQARFLGLTARKTNVEYEGQQINQQRTALSNESAAFYSQLLQLEVPTVPNVNDYMKDIYTAEVGGITYTLGTITPNLNTTSEYEYLVQIRKTIPEGDYVAENNRLAMSAHKSVSADGTNYLSYNGQTPIPVNFIDYFSLTETPEDIAYRNALDEIFETFPDATRPEYTDLTGLNSTLNTTPTQTYQNYTQASWNILEELYPNLRVSEDYEPEDRDEINDIYSQYLAEHTTSNGFVGETDQDGFIDWLEGLNNPTWNNIIADSTNTEAQGSGQSYLGNLLNSFNYMGNNNQEPNDYWTEDNWNELIGRLEQGSSVKAFDVNFLARDQFIKLSDNTFEQNYDPEQLRTLILTDSDYSAIRNVALYRDDIETQFVCYEVNNETYFITRAEGNNLVNGENLQLYYAHSQDLTTTETYEANLIQDPITGRYDQIIYDEGTFQLTYKQEKDENAYNQAFNEYTYANAKYEEAVQNINAKTEILQAQDRDLELRMQQLNTEHQAIQTEWDAVKKVLDENIKNSFKVFG